MGIVAASIAIFALFIGINSHEASVKHEKKIIIEYEQKLKAKEQDLTRARKARALHVTRLDGVEVVNLSDVAHA